MKSRSLALPPETLLAEADFVRALSRGLLDDPAAAEDVAQEALVAGLERPPEAAGALRGWLARVVRNLVLERGRGESRRAGREERVARTERIPSTAEVLEREAARATVVKAVLALDEPYRTVILLRFYESRPPRAIAAQLGVPVETVHTRIQRALALLRERLDREFGSRSAWAALLLPFARPPVRPLVPSSPFPREFPMSPSAWKLAIPGLVLVAGAVLWSSSRESAPATSQSVVAAPVTTSGIEPDPAGAREPALAEPLASTSVDDPSTKAVPLLPPTPSTAASNTATLHISVTWSDGSPAADLETRVTDLGRSALDPLAARTDTQGNCTIAGLRPGKVWVATSRLEFPRTTVVSAESETTLAIQLERGWDIEGVVVDAQGNAVQGATVWIGNLAASIESEYAAATSGADGSFELQCCHDYTAVWARAAGHAPSLLRLIEETRVQPEGTVVNVTLALGGAGATVTGVVRDPAGNPIEGALVLVDGQDMLHAYPHTLPGGEEIFLSHTGPTSARTDASGHFEVAGVMPGQVPVGVIVPGLAPWRGSVTAAASETAALTITLSSGFRLSGIVRNAAGNPVAARVAAYLSSSQISPTVMAGADGSYEFEGLPAGEVRIYADAQDGQAWTTLNGVAADELTWDAYLGPDEPEGYWIESEPWR